MIRISGSGSIDRDDNCSRKPEETLPVNDTASNWKELTEKEVQTASGNTDGFTRIIHFHESVHVDIPK